jgi:hypothetical protein
MLLRSCQYWNIVTGSVTELSASLTAFREFMLPAGTMLVTQGACDALQSCSELKSTSIIVSSSENVIAAKLNYMRDAMSRSDITQLLDTIILLSSSVNAEKSKVCSRRLLDMPGKEVLSTLFLSMSGTALDSQAAFQSVKVLQTLSIDRVALASMDLSATTETLAKLAVVSSGCVEQLGRACHCSFLLICNV